MSESNPQEEAKPVVKVESKTEQELPPLSDHDFKIYNRAADHMEYFHNNFRRSWNLLWNACTNNRRPQGMSLKQFIMEGLQFAEHLTMHHNIEETYIFPVLAKKMPEFRGGRAELLRQHKEIHAGLDHFEEYLKKCRTGDEEFELCVLKTKMETWGEVLWKHLDQEVSWIARRTQASLANPGDLIPNKLEEPQPEKGPELRYPRSIQALHLKPLKREAEHGIPSCDLQLRSFSVQPLEFFSDFALRAAYYLGLPAYGPVPLPRITERWTVPRDNFIFKKSQENFERKTLRRLIQIRDGNPETVQVWLAYLRKHQLYGVGMKANMWEFSELGVGKTMDALPDAEKGEIDAKWAHLGQTKTIGTVEKVEELLNQRRFREAAGLRVPPTTSVKPRVIFSGIQPTGIPHLGNYAGALRQWVKLQESHPEDKLIYSIVDLHAITTPRPADELRRSKREALAALLAIGIDPEKVTLFYQSSVPAHSELMWILSCTASVGYLSRMTQWKSKLKLSEESNMNDKAARHLKLGLFSYPVLQAADILVHRATHVPVGEDQRQHLEFARECVTNFNAAYGNHLVSPQTTSSPVQRVMSLQKPTEKMSKSSKSPRSRISIIDSPMDIKSKIQAATTDSIPGVSYNREERPGISNLLDIMAIFDPEGRKAQELGEQYSELSPKQLKDMVTDAVIGGLDGIRGRYTELLDRGDAYLDSIEAIGAEKARKSAEETMQVVREAVGL
ncbi:hypothetical protein FGADI_5519 [Fusarium gaditjirri]|uniref:Small ribosomal subunit protein uS10m n=1 Tax=Fusarium gaditjirri TaxID=282569 RepID=A0A8H4WXJ3_9HYPO|nr:hypothetical protein FGADI_5519 [Fusarium gaditjirri]